jgi:tRNA(Ile)-lysidine synthase TilS/MesJ
MGGCVSCEGPPKISIKTVEFCSECFKRKLIRKVRKELNKIEDDNMLFCITGTQSSLVMAYLLNECVKYRKKTRIELFSSSHHQFYKTLNFNLADNIKIQDSDGEDPATSNGGIRNNHVDYGELRANGVKLAKELNIRTILLEGSTEDISSQALSLICRGDPVSACSVASDNECVDEIAIIRPFSKVLNKEILFFYFLKRNEIPLSRISVKYDDVEKKVGDLVKKSTAINYSTGFNVIETLRKVKLNKPCKDKSLTDNL